MSATRRRTPEAESTPQVPQAAPSSVNYGQHGHDFTLQAVMELHKAVGELTAQVQGVQRSIEKMEAKLDKVEDKVSGVTHKLYAAGVVLAILLTIGGFMVNKAWDLMAAKITEQAANPATGAAAQKPGP